jgi:hypothetical protein
LPRPGQTDIIRSGGERSVALRIPACLFALLLTFVVACGDGDGGDSPSQSQTPDDSQAIRAVEFESLDAVQNLIAQLNFGEVDERAVIYTDLTGDRREEAIVPVTSQGTQGNVGYLVFTLDSDEPEVILTRTVDRTSASGLQMSAEDGVLLETRGEFGPEDALCCPSQLRETTFRWDGSALQVDNEVLIQQDPGPKR